MAFLSNPWKSLPLWDNDAQCLLWDGRYRHLIHVKPTQPRQPHVIPRRPVRFMRLPLGLGADFCF